MLANPLIIVIFNRSCGKHCQFQRKNQMPKQPYASPLISCRIAGLLLIALVRCFIGKLGRTLAVDGEQGSHET
jgi:hypothetical protein